MSSGLVSNLLRLSYGLSLSVFIVTPYAKASVGGVPSALVSPHLLAQFEPTGTESPDRDTLFDTTGGHYFQPPVNGDSLRGPTTTTGTRGNCSSLFASLGPRSMVGRTTSARPEFVWYLTEVEAASPVLFRLLEIDDNGQTSIVDSVSLVGQSGFMRYQLPATTPALEVGKDYLWQVIVQCEFDGGQSKFLASSLQIQLVTSTPELTDALALATTDVERAQVYGNAGIWYDAFSLVSAGANVAAQEVRTGLLQDLATLESNDELFREALDAIAEQTAPERSSNASPLSTTSDPTP